jgi:hypothetical protein
MSTEHDAEWPCALCPTTTLGVYCSMSLSSLDSEQDDPFLDHVDSASSAGLLVMDSTLLTGPGGGRRATRGTGGASTHSLNEADLQVLILTSQATTLVSFPGPVHVSTNYLCNRLSSVEVLQLEFVIPCLLD